MKKTAYLGMLAGLLLTGCIAGDYGIKPADPQTNAQDEIVTLAGTVAVEEAPAIDLAAVTTEKVSVGKVSVAGLDAAEDVKYFLTFDDTYEFEVTSELAIPVEDLQAMVEDEYGKRPVARTFEAALKVNAIINGTALIFESEAFDVTLTPEAPVIENAYYLVGDMYAAWDKANAVKFNHSDKDVYEDPVFTIVFTTTKENSYWKIIPQTNYDGDFWGAGVVGTAVDGDPALEGALVNENAQAGKIEKAGMYMMTINMMDYSYTISALAPEYYILGDAPFAWNVNDKKFLMYAESSSVHTYTTLFEGNVKFINSNDMGSDNWKAPYGATAEKNGSTDAEGVLFKGQPDTEAGAIHVPATGYYTFKVDLADMKYSWTPVEVTKEYESMTVVGDFQDWKPENTATMMTEIAPHNWYIGDLNISTPEFKIAADGAWADSWGEYDMTSDNFGILASGGNIKVNPGTYDVFFNDITKHCTILAK